MNTHWYIYQDWSTIDKLLDSIEGLYEEGKKIEYENSSIHKLDKPSEANKKVHPKNWNIWPDGLREYISIKYDINFNQLTHLGIIEPYYDQWHPKYNCHPITDVWNEINITYWTQIETSTRPCKLERD